MFRKSGLIY